MTTPALYRTRINHVRRAPVRHVVRHRSYAWYVDVDDLPRLPWWLRPLARVEARDHLTGAPGDSLRTRIDAFLRECGVDATTGTVTALLQARVLGYVFNPLSLFWCHGADGVLRHVVAEVHNTYGGRHAYLLPASDEGAATVPKAFYVSPFNDVDGQYRIRAPRPDESLAVSIRLRRYNQPDFVATMHGIRRPATAAHLIRLQFVAPLAPLMGALAIRIHGIALWLRRVPVIPRKAEASPR